MRKIKSITKSIELQIYKMTGITNFGDKLKGRLRIHYVDKWIESVYRNKLKQGSGI